MTGRTKRRGRYSLLRIVILFVLFVAVAYPGIRIPPDYVRAVLAVGILFVLAVTCFQVIDTSWSRRVVAALVGALLLATLAAARVDLNAVVRLLVVSVAFVLPLVAVLAILSNREVSTPPRLLIALPLATFTVAEIILPSAQPRVDILAAALVCGSFWLVPRSRTAATLILTMKHEGRSGYTMAGRLGLLWLCLVWLVASTFDRIPQIWLASGSAPSFPRAMSSRTDGKQVGLTLSGGGYRAALLHAGVLAGLEDLGIPVEAISSVSGGSIVASHYVLGGKPDEFRDLVSSGAFNLARELFNAYSFVPILLSARVPGFETRFAPIAVVSRTHVQAGLLDRILLHEAKLGMLGDPVRPALMLCTTELYTQELLGIQAAGNVRVGLLAAADLIARRDMGELAAPRFEPHPGSGIEASDRLALMVAASGAFPGALDAYEPSHPDTRPMALADGGLTDNLGVMLAVATMKLARSQQQPALDPWQLDTLIMSDGSALSARFDRSSLPNQVQRAIDVMYLSTGLRAQADVSAIPSVMLSPRNLLQPGAQADAGPHDLATHGVRVMLQWQDGPPPVQLEGSPRAKLRRLLPDATIVHLLAELPESEGRCGKALLVDIDRDEAGQLPGVCSMVQFPAPFGQPPLSRSEALQLLLARDLSRRLYAFATTSTLDDRVVPAVANKIFALGRDLVHLKRRALCRLTFTDAAVCAG